MHASFRRTLVVAAVVGLSAPVLAAGGPFLAGGTPTASSVAGPGLAAQLWGWVRTIWTESGCLIDPSGQCGSSAPRPGAKAAAPAARRIRPDSGCTIDPGGQCGSTAPRPGAQASALATPLRPSLAAGGVRR